MTSVRVSDRIRQYMEEQQRRLAEQRARDAQERELMQRMGMPVPERQRSEPNVVQARADLNRDGTEEAVWVDRSRLPELSAQAILEHQDAVIAVDTNGDQVDDSNYLTVMGGIAEELGVTFTPGSRPTSGTAYRGWTSQQIEAPPDFVQNFDYLTRLAEEHPGGRWELSTHPNQGAFVRYYLPDGGLTDLGTTYKETSIIRPNNYGDGQLNSLSAPGLPPVAETPAAGPALPEGAGAQQAVQFADEVLSPTATAEQRTAAYSATQELVNSFGTLDDTNNADITPSEFRTRLDEQLRSMGLPTFRGDGLTAFEHEQLVGATLNALAPDATPEQRRQAFLVSALAVAEQGSGPVCYAEGQLEAIVTPALAAAGIPTRNSSTAPALSTEESAVFNQVMGHAAELAGVSSTQAQPIIDALVSSGGDLSAIPADTLSRLDPQAVSAMATALGNAAQAPELDLAAWLGRAPTDGVTPEETAQARAILGQMQSTLGELSTGLANGDVATSVPSSLQALQGHLAVLGGAWGALNGGDNKVSIQDLVEASLSGKAADGSALADNARQAIRYLLANPTALEALDGGAGSGRADGVISWKDVQQFTALVNSGDASRTGQLNLQEPTDAAVLSVDDRRAHLSALADVARSASSTSYGSASSETALRRSTLVRLASSTRDSAVRTAALAVLSNPAAYGLDATGDFELTSSVLARLQTELPAATGSTQTSPTTTAAPPRAPAPAAAGPLGVLQQHLSALAGSWGQINGDDDKTSIRELTEMAASGKAPDGTQLSQMARTAIQYLVSNPLVLNRLDGGAGSGTADRGITWRDLEQFTAYVRTAGPAAVQELRLNATEEFSNLSVSNRRNYLGSLITAAERVPSVDYRGNALNITLNRATLTSWATSQDAQLSEAALAVLNNPAAFGFPASGDFSFSAATLRQARSTVGAA